MRDLIQRGQQFLHKAGISRLWTPASLGSSLALWLDGADASTITLNGSTVSQWRDKSDNARHVSQATATNQPTYTASGINGKPVLIFDGSDWFKDVAVSLPDFSVMMVETQTQNSKLIYYPLSFNLSDTGLSVGGTFFSQAFAINRPGSSLTTSQVSTLNTPFILFGGSSSVARQVSVNGNTPVSDTATQSISQITIGRRGDATWPFVGTIAEVVLTDNLLSTDDRQKLEGYLAWKWGLEANLPAGHPFKNTPPTV